MHGVRPAAMWVESQALTAGFVGLYEGDRSTVEG